MKFSADLFVEFEQALLIRGTDLDHSRKPIPRGAKQPSVQMLTKFRDNRVGKCAAAGNIFSNASVPEIRYLDLEMPQSYKANMGAASG